MGSFCVFLKYLISAAMFSKGHITLCIGFASWSLAQKTQMKRNKHKPQTFQNARIKCNRLALVILHWLLLTFSLGWVVFCSRWVALGENVS